MPYPTDLTTIASVASGISPCFTGSALTNAGTQAQLARLISAVSRGINRYLSRELTAIPRVEVRNGQGLNQIRALVYPIRSASQITLACYGGGSPNAILYQAVNGQPGFTFDSWFFYLTDRCFTLGKQNITLSYTGGYITPGMLAMQTLPAPTVSSVVGLGAMIQVAGLYYRCITAGTTGATAPQWGLLLNSMTVDGGVVWLCQGAIPTLPPTASYIPEDIEQACIQQVALLYKNQTRVGDTSTGTGPDRVNYFLKGAEATTLDMLRPHREPFPIDGMGVV